MADSESFGRSEFSPNWRLASRRRFETPRFESLECRRLLAADPWQNPVDRFDVNGDGHVTPLDALEVIKALNEGIAKLPTLSANAAEPALLPAAVSTSVSSGATAALTPQNYGYLDVNGTGTLTPLDALAEIDVINPADVSQSALSISSTTVPEPTSNGSIEAPFTVSLSGPITQTVTIAYSTSDNTAVAGVDYTAESGTLTFLPNGTSTPASQTIEVPILVNSNFTGDENFFVNLTSPNPSSTPITQAIGIGTITGSLDLLSIQQPAAVVETGGAQTATFTVSLASATTTPVSFSYATADQSAIAGTNYTATSSTATIPVGATSTTFTVPIIQQSLTTPVSFTASISNASGAYIGSNEATETIYPAGSTLSGAEAEISAELTDTSGNPITASQLSPGEDFYVQVNVQDLRSVSDGGIYAAYLNLAWNSTVAAQNGSVIFGPDYQNVESPGTQTAGSIVNLGSVSSNIPDPPSPPYPDNATQELLAVPMVASGIGTLNFTVSPASGATLTDSPQATLEYNNPDDGSSGLPVTPAGTPSGQTVTDGKIEFVSTPSVNVGANALAIAGPVAPVSVPTTGSTTATFTVTLGAPSGSSPITVNYTTVDGTAMAPGDYTAASGTLTFNPGTTTQTITVTVPANPEQEPNKTFSVTISNASGGATITTATASATLVSSAAAPNLVVTSTGASEGSPATVTVSLVDANGNPIASGNTVTVAYTTSNGTAIAGTNYTTTSGTLTIAPGQTSATITVPTLYDAAETGSTVFYIVLSNPTNATVGNSSNPVTIAYTPPVGISGYVYVDSNNDGVKESGELGVAGVTITLTETSGGSLTETTTTDSTGYYSFTGLQPGTYSITETQPGFFIAGKNTPGTPAPTGATVGNTFNGIVVANGVFATNYDFGELGLRSQFVSSYLNRRAFIASSIITGEYGSALTTSNFNLQQGDVWISFDNGWSGLRTITALYTASQGSVAMTLYDNNFDVLATSSGSPATLSYNGSSGSPYFLKITGTNTDVNLSIVGGTTTAATASSGGTVSTGSPASGSTGATSLFAAASGSSSVPASSKTSTGQVAVVATPADSTSTKAKTTSTTTATDAAMGSTSDWISGFFA